MEIRLTPEYVATWLHDQCQVGDLLLSGQRDFGSRLIQSATNSRYSHAAVVTSPGSITEAYDYSLTFDEDDEGVFGTDFATYAKRTTGLSDLAIYRAEGTDTERLTWTANSLRQSTPTYPTTAAAIFVIAQKTKRMANRDTPRHKLPRLPKLRRQANFFADGIRRVHCAELATRLYAAADTHLDFRQPLLAPYIDVINGPGDYKADDLPSPLKPGRGRAQKGQHAPPHHTQPRKLIIATIAGITDLTNTIANRRLHKPTGDIADYTMPGDLTNAHPLQLVARLHRTKQGTTHTNWERATNGQ